MSKKYKFEFIQQELYLMLYTFIGTATCVM